MKIFYNKNDALEAKKDNEIVISEEQASTSYYFYTVEFDELVILLNKRRNIPFYFHELMAPTIPVKFYIDYERDDLTSEDQHIVCALELQEIIDTLKNSFLPHVAEYLLLEARDPRGKKFSAHVIFHNVWCQNMYSVKQHLMKIGLGEKLDLSVYSIATEKSFRMGFAEKREGRPMLPVVNGKPVPYFNPILFCKSLISINADHSSKRFKHLLPDEPKEYNIQYDSTYECEELKTKSKRIRLLPMTEQETYMDEITNKVVAWIQDFRFDVKVEIEQSDAISADLYIRGKRKCGGGLFCDHMGKVHKHNNMRMKITRIGKHGLRAWVRCLDDDCTSVLQSWPIDFSKFCRKIPSIIKF